jgi:hypothetical protein
MALDSRNRRIAIVTVLGLLSIGAMRTSGPAASVVVVGGPTDEAANLTPVMSGSELGSASAGLLPFALP